MTVVVVYESMYGNTHRISEAIGHGLTQAGAPVEVLSIEAVQQRQLHPEPSRYFLMDATMSGCPLTSSTATRTDRPPCG